MVFPNRMLFARRDVLTKATFVLLCGFAMMIDTTVSVNPQCNFYQDLTAGTVYYAYNPEYPYNYRSRQSCMWSLMSDYRINLTCSEFQLPWSYNCSQDALSIQVNSDTTHRYCGSGTFTVLSETNSMTITLKTPLWSTGGRFLCEINALKRPEDSVNCQCGWSNPTRIVGGTPTGVNEFPMMVGIVDSVNRNVFCGGTIISQRYVLTAGHCMEDKKADELGALVGDHDISTGAETNATVLHRVIQIIVHPDYVRGGKLNDVALLKTERNINFNNQVGPACLPFQHMPDTFGGNFVDVLGWGTTDFGGPTSDILQKVTLSVLTHLQCSKYYDDVRNDQICTYAHEKDSCQMDSGGPVLWKNPTSRRILLIGIIGSGQACAVTGGLNTRVGAYVNWIVSATSDATYCIIE